MSKETLSFLTPPAEKLQNFFGVFLHFQIGASSTAVILSEHGDFCKSKNPSKMLAFACLEHGYFQSGQFESTGHMVKHGSPYLRCTILNCCLPLVSNEPVFAEYYAKYALSELLVCGECGTPYKRCTWVRNGKNRIVWRCISRLEFGTKYCCESPTLDRGQAPQGQAGQKGLALTGFFDEVRQ